MKKLYCLLSLLLFAVSGALALDEGFRAKAGAEKSPEFAAALLSEPDASVCGAPKPLGGGFSDWELVGKGRFKGELGVIKPCDVTVYFCTTDPDGMGVDSWYIDGLFPDGLRVADMPFISYCNIGSADTGVLSEDGKPIMIDELSNHYSVGMASSVDKTLGRITLASLYYTDDPDVVDNVVAYGLETVQLEGDYKDYRVRFSIAGECREGARLKADISFVDATNVKMVCYPRAITSVEELLACANAQHYNADVPVLAQSGSSYFDLPAAGSYTVVATYGKDGGSWEYQAGVYNYDTQWEDAGTAELTDDYLASYYDEFPICTASGIKVQRHTVDDGLYRLVNPYSTTDTWTSVWNKLQVAQPEVNSYMMIDAQRSDRVFIYINPMDITNDDGVRMVFGSAAHYNLINGRTEDQITEKGYWGTVEKADGVSTITFPERSLMMCTVDNQSPLFANNNGRFKVVIDESGAGVVDVVAGETVPVAAYTLTGIPVDVRSAAPGIYLVRYSDGTVRKTIMTE